MKSVEVNESLDCLVVIPSYNSGEQLVRTVKAVLQIHRPVLVVLDASTDGSREQLEKGLEGYPGWDLICHQENSGKGACVLTALDWAAERGFVQALVMDSDGQHPADEIPRFFQFAMEHPGSMILGVPIFGPDAPSLRVYGRKVGNWWTGLVTLWGGIGDSLFGFRCYPVEPSRRILRSIRTARRFDFDTELAVRLYWEGIRPINCAVPVYYPDRSDGGVSHFRYLRDNLLLFRTHTRLVFGMLLRLPRLIRFRFRPNLR